MDKELRITLEDLQFLENILHQQDIASQLGKCEDYLDDEGYCRMCTALQRLNILVEEMQEKNVDIVWIKENK